MDGARVAALTIYPIKGCGGVPVEHCRVTSTGLAGDRTFMVVSSDGRARTQRCAPRLATVRPSFVDGGLLLTSQGREPLTLAPRTEGPRVDVEIFGRSHPAVDQGEAAAAWFSALLGPGTGTVLPRPEAEVRDGRLLAWFGDRAAPVLVVVVVVVGDG